jgi:hypothetical protein
MLNAASAEHEVPAALIRAGTCWPATAGRRRPAGRRAGHRMPSRSARWFLCRRAGELLSRITPGWRRCHVGADFLYCHLRPNSRRICARMRLPASQTRSRAGDRPMAARWTRIHERVQFGPGSGVTGARRLFSPPGRWIRVGPAWVRLGSRSSWQAEDEDAAMIKPVQP